MAITVEDLRPGQVFFAKNQGQCIGPIAVKVVVHWIGHSAVHYKLSGSEKIKETTVERFLEIINF